MTDADSGWMLILVVLWVTMCLTMAWLMGG